MKTRQISRVRREVDEDCAIQRCYTACSGNSLPKFRDNLWAPSSGVKNPEAGFFTLEDGTHKLSRNIGKELPLRPA